jgi:hypothetical protein
MFFFFMNQGYVYLIENTFDGTYKIGFTENSVEERRKQLQTGSSQELVIVHAFPSNHARKLEIYLHRALWHFRHRGEFFVLDADTVNKFVPMCEKAEKNFDALIEHENYFALKDENF